MRFALWVQGLSFTEHLDSKREIMVNNTLITASLRFQRWMTNEALPLWMSRGIVPHKQCHYERLKANGEPDLETNTRVRVQARQAFAFASAYRRGWAPEGRSLAVQLCEFIEKNARHPHASGGYVHLMDSEWNIADYKQDLYDHAFYLLAFAWLYTITGDAIYLDRAESLQRWLDDSFASPVGGWREGDYEVGARRQNPHMHLFESYMSLYEATEQAHWLARAGEIFALFQTRFFDAEHRVLREFFDDNWQPHPDAGNIIEPGHMVEWVWLLHWYGRLSGRNVSIWADALYEKAYQIGFASSGLMFDDMNIDGSARGSTKRSWPMTEVIKANIAQAKAGHKDGEERAAEAIDLLFTYYLDCAKVAGSWVDQRGANDEVVNDFAPASTLYHLMVACTEVVDYCNANT
ncbi:AGE family epimerase/isomerase [Marinagarivorans algicola]|uniref:AGE family epimerase/isomerase n=1 Tax=Marinagarivorans algicola TaxID=1513270 RepID=UPI000AA979B3|nr:AGE family epimerase/isomerase [Marinagarivorans algicola]